MDWAIYDGPRFIYSPEALSQWQVTVRDLGPGIKQEIIQTPEGTLSQTIERNEFTPWTIEYIIKDEHDFALWEVCAGTRGGGLDQHPTGKGTHRRPRYCAVGSSASGGEARGRTSAHSSAPRRPSTRPSTNPSGCTMYGDAPGEETERHPGCRKDRGSTSWRQGVAQAHLRSSAPNSIGSSACPYDRAQIKALLRRAPRWSTISAVG